MYGVIKNKRAANWRPLSKASSLLLMSTQFTLLCNHKLIFDTGAISVLVNGAAGFVVLGEHGMKLTDSVVSYSV